MPEFVYRSAMPVPARDLWAWHTSPGAFERLSPPWQQTRLLSVSGIEEGAVSVLQVRMGPLWRKWVARHERVIPGAEFTDVQVEGPFARWEHQHRFLAGEGKASVLEDRILYELPGWARLAQGRVATELERVFRYRHETLRLDLERRDKVQLPQPGRILISGASGLVGRHLKAYLQTLGHEVVALTRHPRQPGDIAWDGRQVIDLASLEDFSAVIHLAGESIFGRWSTHKKRRILQSRTQGTDLLCESLGRLRHPPKVLISVSGANYYPADGRPHREQDASGSGFLAEVTRAWEAAADPARRAGIRVVHPRLATVLSPAGGALGLMAPVFGLGLGGPIGGRQRFSWIAIDDVLDIFLLALRDNRLQGALNVVAPEVPTHREFVRALGRVLHRPTILGVPAGAARLALGQMASETLLADLWIEPDRLRSHGYAFRHPSLEGALRHLLGRSV